MANIFTQNPLILDTAWTSGTMPAGLTSLTSPQQYRYIKWIAPVTVGDTFVITDLNGNTILQGTCAVAKQDADVWHSARPIEFPGTRWILSQISSGKVELYK